MPKSFLVALAFLAFVGPVMYAAQVFGWEFLTEQPAGIEERWPGIRGNVPMFLLWLGIVWTTTAFGEEMFFRGYLITRLQSAFVDVKFGSVLAVVMPALLFGVAHMYYQGLRGLVMTGLIGLAFGSMFLLFKRYQTGTTRQEHRNDARGGLGRRQILKWILVGALGLVESYPTVPEPQRGLSQLIGADNWQIQRRFCTRRPPLYLVQLN